MKSLHYSDTKTVSSAPLMLIIVKKIEQHILFISSFSFSDRPAIAGLSVPYSSWENGSAYELECPYHKIYRINGNIGD